MRRLRAGDDEGSVLVMALLFLALFSLIIAAALGFANTGLRTAASVQVTRETQYTADAAIEGAINAIRGNASVGTSAYGSNTCFSYAAGQVNANAVDVTCTGRPTSGASAGGAGGGTAPPNAVLTFPSNASEGIVVGAGAMPVITGNATTSQSRTVNTGALLTVQGALTCRTANGTGVTVATVTTACPTAAPVAVDPVYPAQITSRPAPATAPACPAAAVTTVTFSPGWYSSAAALNLLTNGACIGRRFHFTPGTYYFEFADALPAGTHQWLINDATAEVVGGTLTSPATAFPSRCDLTLAGVQFIFGSDSRLALTAGSLELCPPLSATQRIAIYGAKTTPDVVVTAAAPLVLTPATASSTPIAPETASYAPANEALVIDGKNATFAATGNKNEGAITLSGFGSTVPPNAVINKATVRLAHTFLNQAFASYPQLTVTAGDATSSLYLSVGALTTIDVTAQLSTPAKANGVSMLFWVKDKAGKPFYVSQLDGIALDIAYTIPGLKGTDTAAAGFAGTMCTVVVPYDPTTPSTTCPVLRGTGTATAKMAIKGTIYVPLGAVDLSMTGQLNSVAQRGVVARTLQLGLSRGAGYTGSLINLPGSLPRYVLLTANIGGTARLRADVTIDDALGVTPGTSVTVTSWSVIR